MVAIIVLRGAPWCLEHLADELFYNLSFYDHYFQQARFLINKIPVARDRTKFVIKVSDLWPRVKDELEACTKRGRTYVFKTASARIFETIDYNQTQLSIKPFLLVRVDP